MRSFIKALQIALTYIGTIVGAGFASGREILQFFTRFGFMGTFAIGIAALLFIWLGAKLMLLASSISARSFEDLNKKLLGDRAGRWVSYFMMLVLLGVTAVMLAGAGTLFTEHLSLSYQTGLLVTMLACFFLLRKGMNAILAVNSIVVPVMLFFTVFVIVETLQMPGASRWLTLSSDSSPLAVWLSPFLYTAFNLSLAQAVLVPIGASIQNRRILIAGAWMGGIGIGFMLLAGHIALSVYMPGITQYDIPMGGIAAQLGATIQYLYLLLIFSEIFTTLIADVYGLTLQLKQRLPYARELIVLGILLACYLLSQIGFGMLLSTLYPLFGFVSLIWLLLLIRIREPLTSKRRPS